MTHEFALGILLGSLGLLTPTASAQSHVSRADFAAKNPVRGLHRRTAPLPEADAGGLQFVQVTSFTPSLAPAYVLAGNLNGDRKPDLVVVSTEGQGVPSNAYVLLGNGDGSFGSASSYPIGTAGNSVPGQPALADLSGNGKLDLIVPSGDWNVVNVLLGKGDGTFQPFVGYPTSFFSVTGVTVGDFNGDKKLDLGLVEWTTAHGGNLGIVEVLLGNGDGTFGTTISTPLNVGNYTTSIVSGDFNRDGALDAAAGTYQVAVLLGDGNGTFQPEVDYALASSVQSLIAADFNGDGILDLAATNGAQVSVLLGNGDGTFQTPINFAVGATAWGMAAADMNADGKIDLAVATSSGFSVLLGNGDGTFGPGVAVPIKLDQPSIAIADFNNSGHPGVAITTISSVLVFLQGPLPTISVSPAVLNFAPQPPGTTSSPQTVTLTNTGTATLTLSGIAISGADATDFAQTNNCSSTLAVNASCQIKVTSTPNAAGTQTASLNITDNAPGSPQTVALTGTGQDFFLAVNSQPSLTVTPGQAANYSIVVSPIAGFSQTVTLSCSGAAPQSTCIVTPSSVTLDGAISAPVNLAVVTAAASAGLTQPTGGPSTNNPFGLWLAFSGTLGLALLMRMARCRRERRPQWLYGLTLLCLLSIGVAMSACGGGGTQAGTYNPTVTGTFTSGSAKLTHTIKVTLVVQ